MLKETQIIDTVAENKEIILRYKNLLRVSRPNIKPEDRKLIRAAFDFALDAHKEMRRKSGEPYIYHPVTVAHIAAEEMGLGTTTIVSALLHDVVEDTDIGLDVIEIEFGTKIAKIIEGLTKLTKVHNQTESIQAENFRKLLLTLADDIRVILIKIADRLHNMRTLDAMPKNVKLKIASETLYLYAPITHRLGLYTIKSELEDLAMKYLEPMAYKEISEKIKVSEKEINQYIKEFIKPLKQELTMKGFKFKIFGRPKSIYSIWNKIKKKSVEFEDVYDVFAVRVIIDSDAEHEKADCYRVYSIITDYYMPNRTRLRDWISVPKSNGYEALHATVMGPKGKWVEIQIRSKRMDEIAEKGVAAHWKYKEGSFDTALDEWLQKIRDILENPEPDSLAFLDNIKLNLFSEEIYVFTPKGDLKIMPSNSTVLDFAFDIHTDIGNNCIGAKVNHKLVPLSHQLKNGDQVEIIDSNVQSPTEEWLNFVVTANAKSKIKDYINKEKRKIAQKGEEILGRKLKKLKVSMNSDNLFEITKGYNQPSELDLYYNIAKGLIKLKDFKKFKIDGDRIHLKKDHGKGKPGTIEVAIKDTLIKNANLLIFDTEDDTIHYNLAPCCKPIPGDEIVAIMDTDHTNGKFKNEGKGLAQYAEGFEIHKTNCRKAVKLMSRYGDRIVKTKWTKNSEVAFLTGVEISGIDAPGVMYSISKVISGDLKINMQSVSLEGKDGKFEGRIILFVHNTKELNKLVNRLKKMKALGSVKKLEKV